MVRTAEELQQLKGVGAVLAKRMIDSGLDTFAKIAEAGNDGLKSIRGINPRATHAIVKQARQLAEEEAPAAPRPGEEVEQLLQVQQQEESEARPNPHPEEEMKRHLLQVQQVESEAPPAPDPKEEMKQHLLEVRQKVELLALSTRERFPEDLARKRGKKLSTELIRVEDALTQLSGKGEKRRKRAERALSQVEKRLTGLDDASLKKVRKGLKRARKAALKAL